MKENPSRVVFTKPLKATKNLATHWGNICHDALIGRRARDIVRFSTGREFRLHFPTLEEYVTLTPRLVTPVGPFEIHRLSKRLILRLVGISRRCQSHSIPAGYPCLSSKISARRSTVGDSRSWNRSRSFDSSSCQSYPRCKCFATP